MTDEMPGGLVRLAEVTAYNHYLACLVGNPAPRVQAALERMRAPAIGDLVLEISTIYDPARTGTRLGRLARTAREPMYSPEEWDDDGPIPDEPVWYIALSDGREFRWVNADFIAVPTDILSAGQSFVSDPSAIVSRVEGVVRTLRDAYDAPAFPGGPPLRDAVFTEESQSALRDHFNPRDAE